MASNWDDLTSWQRTRAAEALVALVALWYTTFDPLPDIPYEPVNLELLSYLLVPGVLAWWLLLTVAAGARRTARTWRRT